MLLYRKRPKKTRWWKSGWLLISQWRYILTVLAIVASIEGIVLIIRTTLSTPMLPKYVLAESPRWLDSSVVSQLGLDTLPPESSSGVLLVQSTPPGDVYLAGVYLGKSPILLDIRWGVYTMRVERPGYETHRETVHVSAFGAYVDVHLRELRHVGAWPDTTLAAIDTETADSSQTDSALVESPVDRIINGLKEANLAFNTPDSMTVGEMVPLVLLMSFDVPSEDLEVSLAAQLEYAPQAGQVHDTVIRISEMAEAHLTGHGFTIKPVSEIAQWVKSAGSTSWEWSVKADTPGTHMLYLTINAFINYNGETTTQTIETYRREIEVYVEPMAVFWFWLGRLANVIYGLLLIVVGFLINHYLKRWTDYRRVLKEEKSKKRIITSSTSDSPPPPGNTV